MVRVAQVVDGVDERRTRFRRSAATKVAQLLGRSGVEPEVHVEHVELVSVVEHPLGLERCGRPPRGGFGPSWEYRSGTRVTSSPSGSAR